MFSLIITIISVALVTALALATLYFGGETYRDAQLRTNAAAAISQGQQLLAASELFYLHKRTWPSGVAELQSEGYLNGTPSMPGALAAGGLITPALASSQPWAEVTSGAPHFWVRQKVGAALCREINWQARGDNGIYTRALPLLETQCYGTAEPYTVLVHKTDRAVASADDGVGATPSLEDTVGTVAPGETTGNVTPGDLAGKTAPDTLGGDWAEAPTHMLCKLPVLDGSFKPYGTLLRNVIPILNGFEFVPCGIEGHTGPSGVAPDLADGSGGETGPLAFSLGAASPPEAMLNVPYMFDFATLLSMSGAPQPALGDVTWSLAAGALPAGLSLSAEGQLTGTPSELTGPGGAEVTVLAWHTDASAQRAYTLRVGEETLQVTSVSLGQGFACAVTVSGGAKCWGTGGNTGDGTYDERLTPVDVTGLTSGVASISAGYQHACAVTTTGGVKCWGWNDAAPGGWLLVPADIPGLASGVASVDSGAFHTCALTSSGGVKCWGWNDSGYLGDGTTDESWTPVDVAGLASGVTRISAGLEHTCALTSSGGVKCWGANDEGQLGDGTDEVRLAPVDVQGLASGVTDVSAGDTHTCAVTTAGAVKCWGWHHNGLLGDGTSVNQLIPVDVQGLSSGATNVSAGWSHSCAIVSGGVKCWGFGGDGELGDGTASDRAAPVDVVGLTSGVTKVQAGQYQTCAVTTGGALKCWGGYYLGNNTWDSSPTPVGVHP